MTRTLVIGDIHGGYKALIQLMERVRIRKGDRFVFLGDYVDGWSQGPEVLDFLIEFQKEHQCVMLKGNHDALCDDFLSGEKMNELWLFHGGKATQAAYAHATEAQKKRHREFLQTLKLYHLDEQNRLFVHAGFTNLKGVAFEYIDKLFYWDRTLWELAISMKGKPLDTNSPYFPNRLRLYKEIFIGHTPTTRYGSHLPMYSAGVWNVDTGAAFKGSISAMDIDTKEVWQSDPVYLLYPEECGRNQ